MIHESVTEYRLECDICGYVGRSWFASREFAREWTMTEGEYYCCDCRYKISRNLHAVKQAIGSRDGIQTEEVSDKPDYRAMARDQACQSCKRCPIYGDDWRECTVGPRYSAECIDTLEAYFHEQAAKEKLDYRAMAAEQAAHIEPCCAGCPIWTEEGPYGCPRTITRGSVSCLDALEAHFREQAKREER